MMRRKPKAGRTLRFESLERRELLAAYRWLGGTFGSGGLYDWNLAANWFNEDAGSSNQGFPGPQDTARILGGTRVDLSGDVTVGTLIVGEAFRDQSHQIQTHTHTLTFGGGSLDGGYWIGSFVNTGAATVNALTGDGDWPMTLWGSLTNTGTLDFESGRLRTSFLGGGNVIGATIANAADGVLRVHAGASISGDYPWAGSLDNQGRIVKTGGAGTASLGIPVTQQPGSELRVGSGTLTLTGNQHRFEGGSLRVDDGAALEFFLAFVGGTSTQINAPTTVTGPGTVRVRRGEIQLNAALDISPETRFFLESDDFAQSSRLSGAGSLEAGTIDVRKGWLYFATLTNRGELRLSGQDVGDSVLHGSTIINQGSLVFDAPDIEIAGSGIQNTASGTVDILRSGQLRYGIFGGAAFNFREWRNAGLIHQHAGVEGFGINSVQFINEGGTIRVDAGTFDLSGNIGRGWDTIAEATSRDATLIVAPGATLDWHADGGLHGFGGTFQATGGGQVLLGGASSAWADNLVLRGDPGMFRLPNTAGFYGRIENRTGLRIENPNGWDFHLTGDLVNHGQVFASTRVFLNPPFSAAAGRIFNMPGAAFETAPSVWFLGGGLGSDITGETAPLIRNEGLLRLGGAITVNAKLDNLGAVELGGDTLFQGIRGADLGGGRSGLTGTWIVRPGANFRSNPTFNAIAGTVRLEGPTSQMGAASFVGHISGSLVLNADATLSFATPLTNSGRIELAPGSTLRANQGYTQTGAGTLSTTLAAADRFGRLFVSGTAELGGAIEAELAPGYAPAPQDTFGVLLASSVRGGFDRFDSPGLVPAYTETTVLLGRNLFAGDLVVEDVQLVGVNGPLIPKQPFQVRYTVRNDSDATVNGPWSDIVHLDRGLIRGVNAIALGVSGDVDGPGIASSIATDGLGPRESTTITLNLVTPSLPGTWNLFVTADRRGVVPDLDRSNNIGRSATALTIELPTLTLGSSATIALVAGETYYYALTIPAGVGPVQVGTDFQAIDAGSLTALRAVAFGGPGTEWSAVTLPTATGRRAEIDLNDGVAGLYYVAVTSRSGGTVTTTADVARLAISTYDGLGQVRPTLHAGDSLTLTLRGRGFRTDTVFRLGDRVATRVDLLNPSTAVVRFENLAPGEGLRVTATQNGLTATAPGDAFRVVAQPPTPEAARANWATFVDMPAFSRPSREVPVTIRFRNDSAVSQPPPVLSISTDNGSFRLASDAVYRGDRIGLLGVKSNGRPDLYLPGESGSIQLILLPTTNGNGVVSEVVASVMAERTPAPGGAADQPIPLRLSALGAFRPPTISEPAWNAVIGPNLAALLGTTAESYAQALRQAAARLAPDNVDTRDIARLVSYLVRVADDFGALSARFASSAFGVGRNNPYEIRVVSDPDGNLLIRAGGNVRSFRKQGGVYVGVGTDRGVLSARPGGGWILAEPNGSRSGFRADGYWEFSENNRGNRTTTTYDGTRLTSATDAYGLTTTISYNAAGRITAVTDPFGRSTTYAYDPTSQYLTSVVTPFTTTTFQYNPATTGPLAFTIARMVDSVGVAWDYEYDAFGRLARVSRNGGQLPVQVRHGTGADLGEMAIIDPAGAITRIIRGELGQATAMIDPAGGFTDYEYDAAGRLAAVRGPAGLAILERNERGVITALLSAAGIELQIAHDGDSARPATLADPLGRLTQFSYDANGLPTSWTQPDGRTSQFEQDLFGRVTSVTNAAGDSARRAYNAVGALVRIDYPDGSRIAYTRDAQQRVIRIDETAPHGTTRTVALTYDAAGRLASFTDAAGRLIRYEYDAVGRHIRTIADGVAVESVLDDLSRVTAVLRDGLVQVSYAYDSAGNLAASTYANGTRTLYTYDILGRVTRVEHRDAAGAILDFEDTARDSAGRVIRVATPSGTTAYEYDARNQLIAVHLTDGSTRRYDTDAAGNRLGYATDAGNRYLSDSAGRQFAYDALGNLTAVVEPGGGTTSYEYDARGRLIRISRPGHETRFEYDPLGNRSAVIEDGVRTERLINPFGGTGLGDVLAEYDASGVRRSSYLIGGGLVARYDSSGAAQFYHHDRIGNTALMTGAGGAVVATYDYLPFGERLSETGPAAADNPYTFQGQWGAVDHGAGLYELRARFLDAGLGRFTQPDPIGLTGGDLNVYRYARNNPLSFIDPSGLQEIKPKPAPTPGPSKVNPITPAPKPNPDATPLPQQPDETEIVEPPPQEDQPYNPDTHPTKWTPSEEITEGDGQEITIPLFDFPTEITVPGEDGNTATNTTTAEPIEPVDFTPFLVGGGALLVAGTAAAIIYFSGGTGAPLAGELAANVIPLVPRAAVVVGLSNKLAAETPSEQPPQPGGKSSTTQIVPRDPNDITGPGGFGDALYRQPGGTYGYTIRFQNRPDAAAPAQEVFLTQQLDADLDWDTFQLTAFGWADHQFAVPAGRQAYSTRINDPTRNLVVEVSAVFNAATGALAWTFRSLDPISLDLPADALAGFLPPDDDTGRGQGFVRYTIQPKLGATTGTRYDAQASIVFDTEAPLLTNVHSNSIDDTPPTSAVHPLAATSPRAFTVSWGGSDAGSGIRAYDIWYRRDRGPWQLWLAGTTLTAAPFLGESGSTYQFSSYATDNVGLAQSEPPTIVTTTISTDGGGGAVIPTLAAFTVNDGRRQRSQVRSLTLTFSTLVALDAGAIAVRRNGRAVPIATILGQDALGRTTVRIRFRGPAAPAGLIRDGRYRLILRSASIRGADATALDGDHDGRPGGGRVLTFHRLFGDSNGNGRIDRADARALIRAIRADRAGRAFPRYLDANRDGRLGRADWSALAARAAGDLRS
jgi:RHS repeat-associated protein